MQITREDLPREPVTYPYTLKITALTKHDGAILRALFARWAVVPDAVDNAVLLAPYGVTKRELRDFMATVYKELP